MKERLQKIIARAGLASRREAESWIMLGFVTVNGKVAKLGDKADLEQDAIKAKGKLLKKPNEKGVPGRFVLAFHKPRGVLTQIKEDVEGRPTLGVFLKKVRTKVFPIGRLEFNTEGLLLLTNDGDLNEKLLKKPDLDRRFTVKVSGELTDGALKSIQRGTRGEGEWIRPLHVRVAKRYQSKLAIDLVMPGLSNFDLKLLMNRAGLNVDRIVVKGIGDVGLGSLKPGEYRLLRSREITKLIDYSTQEDQSDDRPAPTTRKIISPRQTAPT